MNYNTDMSIGPFLVLHEGNHNENFDPHPQYVGINNSKLLPFEQGKYTQFAEFNTETSFNFKFSLSKSHRSRSFQYFEGVYGLRLDNGETTVDFIALEWIGELKNRIKVVMSRLDTVINVKFYVLNVGGEKFYFQPKEIINEYQNVVFKYNFVNNIVDNLDGKTLYSPITDLTTTSVIPYTNKVSDLGSETNKYRMANIDKIKVETYILPSTNKSATLGTSAQRFSTIWSGECRSEKYMPTQNGTQDIGELNAKYRHLYAKGIILESPDGSNYLIQIKNDGTIEVIKV